MSLSETLIGELQYEAATTRKCLERVPAESFDWKPHEKSMPMGRLATHIAEMVGWIKDTMENPELDFATMDYKPFEPKTTGELIEFFDEKVVEANDSLKNASDEAMLANWKMRNGDKVFFDMPRIAVIRGMLIKHIVHHRGQLSVYLRLNDIAVPEIYGPSADEGSM